MESASFIRSNNSANIYCLVSESNVSFTFLVNPITNWVRFSSLNGSHRLAGPTRIALFGHLLYNTKVGLSVVL